VGFNERTDDSGLVHLGTPRRRRVVANISGYCSLTRILVVGGALILTAAVIEARRAA